MSELRSAIVTGAGSGIGRAVALALQGAGFNVALSGRRADELDKTVALGAASGVTNGAGLLAIPSDITNPAEVEALFEATRQAFGRVDLLFNNAGRGAPPVDIDELDVETWRAVVDVNLTGSFLCAREAFKHMRRQAPKGGRIINNGSISAYAPRPLSTPYSTTKHAITGLTRCLALDGRRHNIACGQIDIGNAATEMTEPMAAGIIQPSGIMLVEGRMDLDHVANAVVHMADLPLEANVLFMTVMSTKMPFVGRG